MEISYNPGLTSAGGNSVNDWTGGGGIINGLGTMLGGLNSDPGKPGSGKPGSSTTSAAASSGGHEPAAGKNMLWAAAVVVAVFLLWK